MKKELKHHGISLQNLFLKVSSSPLSVISQSLCPDSTDKMLGNTNSLISIIKACSSNSPTAICRKFICLLMYIIWVEINHKCIHVFCCVMLFFCMVYFFLRRFLDSLIPNKLSTFGIFADIPRPPKLMSQNHLTDLSPLLLLGFDILSYLSYFFIWAGKFMLVSLHSAVF
jgi:hypothetical protein